MHLTKAQSGIYFKFNINMEFDLSISATFSEQALAVIHGKLAKQINKSF